MNFQKKTILFLLLTSYFLLLVVPKAFAQVTSIGVAHHIEILDNKVKDGDIIVATLKGFALSREEYNPEVFGVVSHKAGLTFKTTTDKKTYSVVTSGTALVKVSNVNGGIKKGDFITTSPIIGTGMLAKTSGFVVGLALENAVFDKSKTAIIPIIIDIHNIQSGSALANIFNLGKIASYEAPTKVVQYLVAAIIALISFGVGFIIFTKTVLKGIEALGRNPLAARTIQFSIIFNLILIIIIIITGTGLAYLVIRL